MNATSTTMAATARRERLSRLGILEEPMGYVDGQNLYEFVGSEPVGSVDPSGLILRDSNGKPKFTPTSGWKAGNSELERRRTGVIYTDQGREIKVIQVEKVIPRGVEDGGAKREPQWNCHGQTFKVEYWINDPEVEKILEDEYDLLPEGENLLPGDVAIYPDKNGGRGEEYRGPDHSGRVEGPVAREKPTITDKDGSGPVTNGQPANPHPKYGGPPKIYRPKPTQ